MAYDEAISILRACRRLARPSLRAPYAGPHLHGRPSIANMPEWLKRLGHSVDDVDRLNVVHVAGTKGKGSTCSMTQSFLRVLGERVGFPRKVGLCTSPHLVSFDDRIRIGNTNLPKQLFTKYFFEVWNKVKQAEVKPRTNQLLILLSIHTFLREGVDAAVFETNVGGEYDSTNVFQRPVVTAITSLGLDHLDALGPTISDIAWHKSGIMKPGVPALSVSQEKDAEAIIRARAVERGANVRFLNGDSRLDGYSFEMPVQLKNCSLALAIVDEFVSQKLPTEMLNALDIQRGLAELSWPGRFQNISDGHFNWYLDIGHNEMSIAQVTQWFEARTNGIEREVPRIIIFSHPYRPETRDGLKLITILTKLSSVQHIIFTEPDKDRKKLGETRTQEAIYASKWKENRPASSVHSRRSVLEALDLARAIGNGNGMHTLITGCSYLVGRALKLLIK